MIQIISLATEQLHLMANNMHHNNQLSTINDDTKIQLISHGKYRLGAGRGGCQENSLVINGRLLF